MKLYELTDQFLALQTALENGVDTDEEWDELCQKYQLTSDEIGEKCESIARMMRNLKAEATAVKEEKQRLAARQTALENSVDKLKQLVKNFMVAIGTSKVKTTIGNYTIQKFPPSVTVTDITKIPERFLTPQPPKVDAKAMIAEWKETGELFNGVEIGQREGVVFK